MAPPVEDHPCCPGRAGLFAPPSHCGRSPLLEVGNGMGMQGPASRRRNPGFFVVTCASETPWTGLASLQLRWLTGQTKHYYTLG